MCIIIHYICVYTIGVYVCMCVARLVECLVECLVARLVECLPSMHTDLD